MDSGYESLDLEQFGSDIVQNTIFDPNVLGIDQTGLMEDPIPPRPSRPLHVQRVEKAIDLTHFLNEQRRSNAPSTSTDGEQANEEETTFNSLNILSDGDDINDGVYFNVDFNDSERTWLTDILNESSINVDSRTTNRKRTSENKLCETQSDDNVLNKKQKKLNFKINMIELLKIHKKKKECSKKPEKMEQNLYYGSGIISNFDKYPEHKKTLAAKYPKKKSKPEETITKPINHQVTEVLTDMTDEPSAEDLDNTIDIPMIDEEANKIMEIRKATPKQVNLCNSGSSNNHKKSRSKKFKDEESKRKWEEMMQVKRKKLFTAIVKKEVSKQQRGKVNKHKEALIQCKRAALQCQKVVRNKALQSARVVKELQWRMKRLARENLAYWKRSKRVDREIRRKLEKEAEEQRKMDFELVEAKRQQRKLNFLITQTELYAHFMSKKLDTSPEEQLRILSQLDEERNPRLATIDDYDSEVMKAKAIRNAQDAFQSERARTREFDRVHCDSDNIQLLDTAEGEHLQPAMFRGTLKAYQLRGMNWLANLYDQGISGILADEMGLGKTVQSIAFLSHLAEVQNLWGPFLVICPASTLHNWQQEFAKFVPEFIVVPYWGNPSDRKILRQFWNHDRMHTKDAGFHVVITSYQIVISDVKYFNRIKWLYMVLDEAQAIKSTSSMRWKTLLGFNCRNRLLLSGTPIQNSMAELWALLHFIMPTLFDSHEEFNEWFSKDIESHAENKTGIDEKHLSRLHMILKPFMLRRIKKDVENELSDKIEVMVYCPLTTRQNLLYLALKQKIRIEDLLHYTVGGGDSHSVDKNFTSNLMNLVMQFRKVCNHPELFERRDAKSPVFMLPSTYHIPKLIYDCKVRLEKSLILDKYFTFTTEYIKNAYKGDVEDSIFTACYLFGFSPEDLYKMFRGDILHRWRNYFVIVNKSYFLHYRKMFDNNLDKNCINFNILPSLKFSMDVVNRSHVLSDLIFTCSNTGRRVFYTHTTQIYNCMPETVEHRNIRCKTKPTKDKIEVLNEPMKKHNASLEFNHIARPPQKFYCQKTELPSFLFSLMPKVITFNCIPFCPSRRAAYNWMKHIDDWSWHSLNYHWSVATDSEIKFSRAKYIHPKPMNPVENITPMHGWSHINIPDKETLVTDSGKLSVLDGLLKRLKEEGHRVLIYSQMTKMIDLLEEYMWHRHHKYMRLDGSSKISERRDMVADFQARTDIFVFLLSTRAGGLGINLTAADTVIFYDSDWNPTVDQQAMDRAHRLGQTKQVTVYRLICKGTIEERILQRAREKSEIQKLVISGGNFKPDTLKPKEVVSLLLDDEEIELKYRQRAEERRHMEDMREKRKYMTTIKSSPSLDTRKIKLESSQENCIEDQIVNVDSAPNSPRSENSPDVVSTSDDLNDNVFLDVEGDLTTNNKFGYTTYNTGIKSRPMGRGASKRGRPRGSRRISALGRFNSASTLSTGSTINESPTSYDSGLASTSFSSFDSPTSQTSTIPSPTVRRGPGRPRLKPSGPGNAGSRGTYRPRKPARPLPVPLPSDGNVASGSTQNVNSASYSTYLYGFPESDS